MQEEKNCTDLHESERHELSITHCHREKPRKKLVPDTKPLAVSDKHLVFLASHRIAERTSPQSVIQAALPVLQTASRLAASPNAPERQRSLAKLQKTSFELILL